MINASCSHTPYSSLIRSFNVVCILIACFLQQLIQLTTIWLYTGNNNIPRHCALGTRTPQQIIHELIIPSTNTSNSVNQGQARHSAKPSVAVLTVHCLLFARGCIQYSTQLRGALLQVHLVIVRVVQQRGAPRMALQRLTRDHHSRRGDRGGQEREHGVLLQRPLGQVAGQLYHAAVGVCGLEIAAQESVGSGQAQLVLQCSEDLALHVQEGVASVGVVADLHQFSDERRVDLLILGGNLVKYMSNQ